MFNTEKLELPSISQVQTRGPVDSPWYNSNYSRPKLPSDRLPDLHLPQSYASTTARVGVSEPLSSAHGIQYSTAQAGSYSDNNTGIGLKTPSPSPTSLCSAPPIHGLPEDSEGRSDYTQPSHYPQSSGHYSGVMNQQHPYLESQQSQMSGGQPYAPHSTTASGMTQYSSYAQPQPPPLQPGPGSYAQSPGYGQYGYPNSIASPSGPGHPVSSSMGGQMNSGLLPLPAMGAGGPAQHTYVGAPTGAPPNYPPQNPDTSGQVAPSGMKPRVTATLWEDEGCMCFQVEAKGVCVARRDDNHMINGTKLLNVAGMTRGRRDGILKSEKTRHVVKIGPMHLKGVWIPFDRALDFANKEKITESLYPLFVHNIGALLYHPTNQSRTNAVMAAADRRRLETSKAQSGGVGHPGSQPPSLHHHHSMGSSINSQQPHSIAPHPGAGRPGLDRAHTFPTPPTSASSTSIGLNNQGSYGWEGQSIPGSGQPLMLDSHPHSTPATPATTPPGVSMPTLQPYQSHQSYDNARAPIYSSAAPQQGQYATQHQQQGMPHGAPLSSNSYPKQDMGPPATRAPGSKTESEHGDSKNDLYGHSQGNDRVGHEEAEHEQEGEYSHDNSAYAAHRAPYNHYSSASHIGPLHGEHAQAPSEINGSQSHQNGSGRSTPRTSNGSQQQWSAAGYHTPPRAAPSSNLYNPMSDTRGTVTNGSNGAEHYSTAPLHPYAPTQANGVNPSNKRMREDEEYTSRPESRNDDIDSMKRRKMGREGSGGAGKIASSSYDSDVKPVSANRPRSIATPRAHR